MLSRSSVVLLADWADPVVASESESIGLPFTLETGPEPGASKARVARANRRDETLLPRERGILKAQGHLKKSDTR